MKTFVVLLITIYQKLSFIPQAISQTIFGTANQCIYTPTCSEYMTQAVQKYGVVKGLRLGLARIARCRPGNAGGYDPVK